MLKTLFRGIIDLIYPPFCKVCDQRLSDTEKVVCDECLNSLQLFDSDNAQPPETEYLKTVHGTFTFDDTAQQIIHFLKYSGNYSLGVKLGQLVAKANVEFLGNFTTEDCLVIPVPLHSIKKRTRGYNQAEAIAKGIAMESGLICNSKILKRAKNTSSQTKLNKEERRENMTDAFTVGTTVKIPKTVIVIDDVFTTGATIDSAARILTEMGVSEVHALTVARPVK